MRNVSRLRANRGAPFAVTRTLAGSGSRIANAAGRGIFWAAKGIGLNLSAGCFGVRLTRFRGLSRRGLQVQDSLGTPHFLKGVYESPDLYNR